MFPTKPFFSEGQTLCQRRSEDRVGRAGFSRCWSHGRGRVPHFCTPLASCSRLFAGVCVRQDSSKLRGFLTSPNLPRLRSEIWGSRGRRFKSCQPDWELGVSRCLLSDATWPSYASATLKPLYPESDSLMSRAGFPTQTLRGGMEQITTEPAPITEFAPISLPSMMTAPAPMNTPRLSLTPLAIVAPGPMVT